LIASKLRDTPFVVVANREPFQHRRTSGEITCVPSVSGLVSALDPILRACHGTWIAHGSGNADRDTVDAHDHLVVPPDDPSYTLRRVWLTPEQEAGYYDGLANEGLWPLCHNVFTRPIYDPRSWNAYREVNELFADAVLEEVGDTPAFVFIQDYHFALLPRLLKDAAPQLLIAQFWHIPWPSAEVFQTCPWKEELLHGLLGNDLLGFHLRYHCQNFLATVEHTIEARADRERFEIIRGGKSTLVRPFPISIDFEDHEARASTTEVEEQMQLWRERLRLRGEWLGLGIDRIDYTKGIPERLRALDLLFERHPEFRGRLLFVQIGVPSRLHVRGYRQIDEEIDRLVGTINDRWGRDGWQPVVYLKRAHGAVDMMALHRLADFSVVSSLDDGMNLVAKEFVASRIDGDGVLVLSRFTGAARELTSALLVNPFDIGQLADAMQQALVMPADERRRRMAKMREAVAENNVYRWAGKFLTALARFETPAGELQAVAEEVT
jgi:trehalose 6-phosphate synthase